MRGGDFNQVATHFGFIISEYANHFSIQGGDLLQCRSASMAGRLWERWQFSRGSCAEANKIYFFAQGCARNMDKCRNKATDDILEPRICSPFTSGYAGRGSSFLQVQRRAMWRRRELMKNGVNNAVNGGFYI